MSTTFTRTPSTTINTTAIYTRQKVHVPLAQLLPPGAPHTLDLCRFSLVGDKAGIAAQRLAHFTIYGSDAPIQTAASWPPEAWDPDHPDVGARYGITWIRMRDLHHNATGDEPIAAVVLVGGHLIVSVTLSSTLRHLVREDGEDENGYAVLMLGLFNHYPSLTRARWAEDPTRAARDEVVWALIKDKARVRNMHIVVGGQDYDLNDQGQSLALDTLGMVGTRDDPARRRKLTGKRLGHYRAGGAGIAESQLPQGWAILRDAYGRPVKDDARGLRPVGQPERVEALQRLYALAAAGTPWTNIAAALIELEADGKITRRSHVDPGATFADTASSVQAGYDAAKSIFVRSNHIPATPPDEDLIARYEAGEDPVELFDADTRMFLGKVELVRTGRYFRRLRSDVRGRGTVIDGIPAIYDDDADLYGHFDVLSEPWPWPIDPDTDTPVERFGIPDETCRRVGARLLRELRTPPRRTGGRAHQGRQRRVLLIDNAWTTPAGDPVSCYPDEDTQWGVQARQNNSGKENFILLTRRASAGTGKHGGRRGWSHLGDSEGLPAHTVGTGSLAELTASVAVALNHAVETLLDPTALAPAVTAVLPATVDPRPALRARIAEAQRRHDQAIDDAEGLEVQAGRRAKAGDLAGADRYDAQATGKRRDAEHLAAQVADLTGQLADLDRDPTDGGEQTVHANISVAAYLVAGLERAAQTNGRGPADLGQLADTVLGDWRITPDGDLLRWTATANLPLRDGGHATLPLAGTIANVRTRVGRARPNADLIAHYLFAEGRSLDEVAAVLGVTRKTLLTHQVMPWLARHGITSRGAKNALVDHPFPAVPRLVHADITGTHPADLTAWPVAWVNHTLATYRDPDLWWGDAACPDDTTWIHQILATLDTPHAHRRGLTVTGLALATSVTERDIRALVLPQRRPGGFTRPRYLRYLPGSHKTRVQLIPCPHGCRRAWANHAALLPEVAASGYAVLCPTCRRTPNTTNPTWARIAFTADYLTPITSTGSGGSLRHQPQTQPAPSITPLHPDAVA